MFFSILKKTADVSILAAALIFLACGSDSSSNATSATDARSSSGGDLSDSSNVANSSPSEGNSTNSEAKSSSSAVSYTKLAWEFMNPDIDYIEFTDERDGQVYRAVVIGEQTWMAQNLSYNRLAEYAHNNCAKASIPDSCGKYGILYDFTYRNEVCPSGWHLPSSNEWNTLIDLAGGSYKAQKKLRTTTGWPNESSDEDEGNGSDEFGFSAYPTGFKVYSGISSFGKRATFWTSSFGGIGPMIAESEYGYFRTDQIATQSTDAHAIRCIKDSVETELSAE